jgi:hypothetical protein
MFTRRDRFSLTRPADDKREVRDIHQRREHFSSLASKKVKKLMRKSSRSLFCLLRHRASDFVLMQIATVNDLKIH